MCVRCVCDVSGETSKAANKLVLVYSFCCQFLRTGLIEFHQQEVVITSSHQCGHRLILQCKITL